MQKGPRPFDHPHFPSRPIGFFPRDGGEGDGCRRSVLAEAISGEEEEAEEKGEADPRIAGYRGNRGEPARCRPRYAEKGK